MSFTTPLVVQLASGASAELAFVTGVRSVVNLSAVSGLSSWSKNNGTWNHAVPFTTWRLADSTRPSSPVDGVRPFRIWYLPSMAAPDGVVVASPVDPLPTNHSAAYGEVSAGRSAASTR